MRKRRANHLRGQTSPYLLQHLFNPVDWYPWGTEALERARAEDKPLFVSIGYAACHWCHVMERESFESEAIATRLNDGFVSIKIDREERPDIDEIYMMAVQLMTGQGGWPLNVFLTPDLEPFFGGTYFPPEDRWGHTGFPRVLDAVLDAWRNRRADVAQAAAELTTRVRRTAAEPNGTRALPGAAERARAVAELASRFDDRWGGFGSAPKFPPDTALALLLGEHARTGEAVPGRMVETTLDGMAFGGMYDHVGGGFARYSVDERWLVPHFEKMLYNQALLAPNYIDGWLRTGKPLYRRVTLQTLQFVRRELTHPDGGCWSSLDADSEGVEGKFYVWTPDEVRRVLGNEDSARFCAAYGIDEGGNFEGRSIPNRLAGVDDEAVDAELAPLRRRLLAARGERVRPATDDKVLTAWNGLMITAFCRGYQAFRRPEDLDSARRAAAFLRGHLWRDDRLLVSWRDGRAQLNAYLDDYAFTARGLIDLYESAFDGGHLEWAERLAEVAVRLFADDRGAGGWYFTSHDHERLIARTRSLHDGALPAGGAVMSEVLLRLAIHLDRNDFRDTAVRALSAVTDTMSRAPSAFASTLLAAEWATRPVPEVVIAGDPSHERTRELLDVVRGRYLPHRVVALAVPGVEASTPLLEGKATDGDPTAYVCRERSCREPTGEPARLAELLDEAVGAG